MNQDPSMTWSPMGQGPEEDFANILDFPDLQFDFSQFANEGEDGVDLPHDAAVSQAVDTNMEEASHMGSIKDGDLEQRIDPNLTPHQSIMTELGEMPGSTESLMELNMRAQLYHQQYQHQQSYQMHRQFQHGTVPPTPTSMEMSGSQHFYRYADPHAQTMYQQYFPKRQDQTIFASLVSPAVTPLENNYQISDHHMSREHFSPLTSPALQAQNQDAQLHAQSGVRGSDTSDTMSPVEMNVDVVGPQTTAKSQPLRKSKRKATSTAPKPLARTIKHSPAMKPLPKKKQADGIMSTKEVNDILKDVQKGKNISSSEADSVSPEPPTEALMPPPATPRSRSAARSPMLAALPNGSQSAPMPKINESPATPASLMRIQKDAAELAKSNPSLSELKQQSSNAEAEMEQIMEDMLTGDGVAASRPALRPIDTKSQVDKDATPTMLAKEKRVSSAPKSAPLTATKAAFPSSSTAASSQSATVPKHPGVPNSRKRASSSHVSPALRPRISPSIQPLLPEGTPHLSSSTTTALLASKSNYQNILDGTQVPGLTYPSTLATNLTSKRTSHKIAEQGRRNRINTALGEIAALLPPGLGGSNADGGEGSGGTGGNSGNSKARTVEAAIEYIRMLKGEVKELKGKLEGVEKQGTVQADEQSTSQEGVSLEATYSSTGGAAGNGISSNTPKEAAITTPS